MLRNPSEPEAESCQSLGERWELFFSPCWLMAVKYKTIQWHEPAVRAKEIINAYKITAGKLRKVYT
jgi:hypothetical protein